MTTIGILGAGQLGRMLALAGYPLGLKFRFLDPAVDSPAGHLAPHLATEYSDDGALSRFLTGVDVVTYEFENVPLDVVKKIQEKVPVYPPPIALEKGQDRLVEKSFFRSLGVPTPDFADVSPGHSLSSMDVERVGFPAVLKTRRMGYDGKGQFVVHNRTELAQALEQIQGQDAILEQFIQFEREVSIIAVRGRNGRMAFYPLTENTHREGILRLSIAPAPKRTKTGSLLEYNQSLQSLAEVYATAILTSLDYVGVLAIEFFQMGNDLLANEMAPRVHNSGHWTIDGAVISQFENHVRAVADLPLGETEPTGVSAMVNLIGELPDIPSILRINGAHLHLYGKAPRPGRKLGHITLVERDYQVLMEKLNELGMGEPVA